MYLVVIFTCVIFPIANLKLIHLVSVYVFVFFIFVILVFLNVDNLKRECCCFYFHGSCYEDRECRWWRWLFRLKKKTRLSQKMCNRDFVENRTYVQGFLMKKLPIWAVHPCVPFMIICTPGNINSVENNVHEDISTKRLFEWKWF